MSQSRQYRFSFIKPRNSAVDASTPGAKHGLFSFQFMCLCVPRNAPANVQHHTAHQPPNPPHRSSTRALVPHHIRMVTFVTYHQDCHEMMTSQQAIKRIAKVQNTGKCEMRQILSFVRYLVSAACGIYDKYGCFGQFLVRKVTLQSMTCQSFILAPAVKINCVFGNGSD